jgi:hypothetical protein
MGGAWNQDGAILFVTGLASGIKRISANGGAVTQVTTIDSTRGEITHQFPVFLPDGRHFLFFARNTDPAKSCVYLASLEGGAPRQLLLADSRTVAVAVNPSAKDEGWLLFTRQDVLLAQPFDLRRNQLVGERVQPRGTGGSGWLRCGEVLGRGERDAGDARRQRGAAIHLAGSSGQTNSYGGSAGTLVKSSALARRTTPGRGAARITVAHH